MSEPITYLDAAVAAQQVGVSTSGLRRLAPIYEQVYGLLPRSGKGSGDSPRLWSPDAVSRLAAARRLVESGQHRSVRIALEALQGVESTDGSLEAILEGSQLTDRALLEALVTEVRALRSEVARLQATDKALPQAADQIAAPDRSGLLVRLAVRIDSWFKKWF